jgi:polyhydroxyalkanoate synthase
VVNNYLLGKEPPAFDVLYWNQDTVRVAAGLHRDFIRMALDNSLARPGALSVLDTPIDLGLLELDSYVVAGLSDHIVPWENALRSAALLGGESRFVLSNSGHIQALVNPPGPGSRASYRAAASGPIDPDEWLPNAALTQGSWWPDYVEWLATRSGQQVAAPAKLGSREYRAAAKAPGSYVHAT